ncbi:glutathione S-transferase [Kineobactrum sediminis]|uniref:Glutathione S-transferase n=1 Tax=Kineobactrum sediminis TaxID=1905677 RepID=A0A2N5XYE1_9GAMM|nr:glutathione S-transferase family protein [Kineobactrum sediminis]PLW81158.1 glutathione S-transferase [Kineobactrum sediminis]
MKLWHCAGARSLRPLWTLEELGLEYELEVLAFPPRLMQPDYLEVNSLGTVPFFVDGSTEMTESTGICQYLVDRYENHGLGLPPEDPDYGAYLNWLHHSDATLTFPQTIVMRYYFLEQDASKRVVADDYAKWFRARLRRVNERVEQHDYLVADRFTIADIAVGYALFLGSVLHLDKYYKPATAAYLERLMARPAFQRANAIGEALALPDVV